MAEFVSYQISGLNLEAIERWEWLEEGGMLNLYLLSGHQASYRGDAARAFHAVLRERSRHLEDAGKDPGVGIGRAQ
jgi:hypothetical protein